MRSPGFGQWSWKKYLVDTRIMMSPYFVPRLWMLSSLFKLHRLFLSSILLMSVLTPNKNFRRPGSLESSMEWAGIEPRISQSARQPPRPMMRLLPWRRPASGWSSACVRRARWGAEPSRWGSSRTSTSWDPKTAADPTTCKEATSRISLSLLKAMWSRLNLKLRDQG